MSTRSSVISLNDKDKNMKGLQYTTVGEITTKLQQFNLLIKNRVTENYR